MPGGHKWVLGVYGKTEMPKPTSEKDVQESLLQRRGLLKILPDSRDLAILMDTTEEIPNTNLGGKRKKLLGQMFPIVHLIYLRLRNSGVIRMEVKTFKFI